MGCIVFTTMKIIIVCFTLFVSTLVYSEQSYNLQGNIKQMAGNKVELLDFYGNKNSVIDSSVADKDGIFKFQLDAATKVGMYRLQFAKDKIIDVIYNHEDIYFTIKTPDPGSDIYSLADNIEIIQSVENKLYYEFLRLSEHNQRKQTLLNQLKALYQQDRSPLTGTKKHDSFYKRIDTEIDDLNESQDVYLKQLASNNPQTFVANMLTTLQNPIPKKGISAEEKKTFIRDHFFDRVDFSEISLLRTNVIPTKIMSYFVLYNNGNLSTDQQEEAFIKAVDVVMSEVEVNDTMYDFVLDIITRTFEKSDYELVFTYITENYVLADSCKNESAGVDEFELADRKSELKNKIERIRKLAVGKTAPEIIMGKQGGDNQKLTDIKAEYTLVLFWASWCQHCGVMLPQVKEIYNEYKDNGLEVVAISIDKDKGAWVEAIVKGGYSWINYCDLAGWDSKAAVDYNVWATPKMYLLDKDKKIIAKPLTVDELEEIVTPMLLRKLE
ncbi:MAG: thioredoxin-like domain-containing protein [Candidatus Anammoxibacter sp.]